MEENESTKLIEDMDSEAIAYNAVRLFLQSCDIDEVIFMQESNLTSEYEDAVKHGQSMYLTATQQCLVNFLRTLKEAAEKHPNFEHMEWVNRFRSHKYRLDELTAQKCPDENEISRATQAVLDTFNDPIADFSLFPFPRFD